MFNIIIERFEAGRRVIFLTGNVNDDFYYKNRALALSDTLVEFLTDNNYNLHRTIETSSAVPAGREQPQNSSVKVLNPAQFVQQLEQQIKAAQQEQVIIVKDIENLFYPQEQIESLIAIRSLISQLVQKNLFLIMISQIPASNFLAQHPDVSVVSLPKPDVVTLTQYYMNYFSELHSATAARLSAGLTLKQAANVVAAASKISQPGEQLDKIIKSQTLGGSLSAPSPWEALGEQCIQKLQDNLTSQIKGQDHVIKTVLDSIKSLVVNVPLIPNRPKAVHFFAGSTGTGKTQVCKIVADSLLGPNAFKRFDMSEYQEPHKVSTLVGAPSGYVNCENGGVLTNFVRDTPFSVILFDEIEKAHPDIFKIFLQILSDARLTSSLGETVSFQETIIIFTSNIGFEAIDPSDEFETVRQKINSAVEQYYKNSGSPELYGRIDSKIAVFDILREPYVAEIITFHLACLQSLWLERKQLDVKFSDGLQQWLKSKVNRQYGARNVETQVEVLNTKLAVYVFHNKPRGLVHIDVEDDEVIISH